MTSTRKIKANRINAGASTGPAPRRGKAHSAQNSLRHGLSLPIRQIPLLAANIEALA